MGFVGIRSVPVTVAFDVILRFAGKERHAGTIVRVPGEKVLLSGGSLTYPEVFLHRLLPPGTSFIDVVLRSNPRICDNLVDMIPEIWSGEIVFENVPVSIEPLDRKR